MNVYSWGGRSIVSGNSLQDYVAGIFKKDYDQFYKKHRASRFFQVMNGDASSSTSCFH
jgi:hypothetical protein